MTFDISINNTFYCCISAGIECDNGVVISNRPLKDLELFEVQIMDITDQQTYLGSIKVGITALQADTMEISATIMDIQSNTWIMSGCNIVSRGKILKTDYGINLDSLKVCVCACMHVCVSVCQCLCLCLQHVSVSVCLCVSMCVCVCLFTGLEYWTDFYS